MDHERSSLNLLFAAVNIVVISILRYYVITISAKMSFKINDLSDFSIFFEIFIRKIARFCN